MFQHYFNRKNNRLAGYDYSQDGFYFVTVCVKDWLNFFGCFEDGHMILNKTGNLVKQSWNDLPKHYENCRLDEFIIMPNHIHGIIIIDNKIKVGTDFISVPTIDANINKKYSLSQIVQGLKIFCSRKINQNNPEILFKWQRSFYDHIVRDEESLYYFREYIRNNPLRWFLDRNNLENIWI